MSLARIDDRFGADAKTIRRRLLECGVVMRLAAQRGSRAPNGLTPRALTIPGEPNRLCLRRLVRCGRGLCYSASLMLEKPPMVTQFNRPQDRPVPRDGLALTAVNPTGRAACNACQAIATFVANLPVTAVAPGGWLQ